MTNYNTFHFGCSSLKSIGAIDTPYAITRCHPVENIEPNVAIRLDHFVLPNNDLVVGQRRATNRVIREYNFWTKKDLHINEKGKLLSHGALIVAATDSAPT
jgi:N-methylhydantoinase B/oxoprolinase/acetone carboxylase alpha subunit